MKNQALFSSKDKSKKLKCCPLQFLCGILRIKHVKMSTVQLEPILHINPIALKMAKTP